MFSGFMEAESIGPNSGPDVNFFWGGEGVRNEKALTENGFPTLPHHPKPSPNAPE